MILGYKSNYDRRSWIKIIASMLVMSLFIVGFLYLLLVFVDTYIVWLDHFLDDFSLPSSVVEEVTSNGNISFLIISKHLFTLTVIFTGGIWAFAHFGLKICFYLTKITCNILKLNLMMRLSFKKVNQSKIDPLIRWLNK